jgi:hypothetical protein
LVAFFGLRFTASLSEKKNRKRKVETGTVNNQAELGDEWLEGTSAAHSLKKGQKGKGQKGQKSKSK